MPTSTQQPQHPFASPNAIPPRTSSTGVFGSLSAATTAPSPSSNTSTSTSTGANPATASTSAAQGPEKQRSAGVLRPLSENDWMALGKKSKAAHEGVEAGDMDTADATTGNVSQVASATDAHASTATTAHSQSSQAQPAASTGLSPDLISGSGATWTGDKERILLGPYDYLYGHPGKDIRSQCIKAFNLWLRVPEDRLEVIREVVGMLHTASLLVDDVEDSSILRRGIPVAHAIFGTPQTINSANYVYFRALSLLLSMQNPRLIDIFTEELLNLHRGQGMDLYWRDSLTCPTEADYLEMVGNKTGGLFRLAVRLMMEESRVDIDCTPLVSHIGVLFQILDDHLNLLPPPPPASGPPTSTQGHPHSVSHTKGTTAEDLTEGKFSFPIIHAIRSLPSNTLLQSILKQRTQDDNVKGVALAYVRERGSLEYSRRVIEELGGRVRGLVGEIVERLRGLGAEGGEEGRRALEAVLGRLVVPKEG